MTSCLSLSPLQLEIVLPPSLPRHESGSQNAPVFLKLVLSGTLAQRWDEHLVGKTHCVRDQEIGSGPPRPNSQHKGDPSVPEGQRIGNKRQRQETEEEEEGKENKGGGQEYLS